MALITVLGVCKSLCVYRSMRINYNRNIIAHEEKGKNAAEEALS